MKNSPATTAAATDPAARTFTMSIDIDATPDDVWRALTDAGELVRWFPLQARVTPGPGGTVFWGWDDHWAWESQIDAWEPGNRLRLTENRPAFDVSGNPLSGPSQQMAMEFTLETNAGRTRLRLVHSGFAQGDHWNDELDSVSAGWQFELRALRHYLERHKGRDRHHAAVHAVTPLGTDAVWSRLLSPAGFTIEGGHLAANQPCTIVSAAGDRFDGRLAWHNPGHDLVIIVDDLDDGIFRLSTWRANAQTGVQAWIVSYDPRHVERVQAMGRRTHDLICGTLFA